MKSAMPLPPPTLRLYSASGGAGGFGFQSLVLTQPASPARRRGATLAVSFVIHAVLVAAVVLLPLVWYDSLPAPGETVRAFFAAPPDVAPPPPPPPPPPAGARAVTRAPAAPRPAEEARFVAPVEVPAEIKPEESLDFGIGIEGGVPGGVEGGVPGGVVGGIVGGLPAELPASAPRVVRVGGGLVAPKLVHRVNPEYPALAAQARLKAILILEAQVDTRGHVKAVRVLRGAPLFDEPALAAVQQWRYQPLLLNGVPTEFILTVTVVFNLVSPESQ